MFNQHNDPLKEALQGDSFKTQNLLFSTLLIWFLKACAVGLSLAFSFSLITNALPKDTSPLMTAFASCGVLLVEVCFFFSTVWIKLSRNGTQTALAWAIFAFSLICLLSNIVTGAIVSEGKQATLGRGWLEIYLVIMPATGLLCSVLVILWSQASPEASAARRNSVAQGLLSQRYETARLRTALHDAALGEQVDMAASRDAWSAVARGLGLPSQPIAALPAPMPTIPAQPIAPAIPAMSMPTLPAQPQPQQADQPAQGQEVELSKLLQLPAIQQLIKAYVSGQSEIKPTQGQEKPKIATYAADSGSMPNDDDNEELDQQEKNS